LLSWIPHGRTQQVCSTAPNPPYCTTCATNTLSDIGIFSNIQYDLFLVQKKIQMEINIQNCFTLDRVDVWVDWNRNGFFEEINDEHVYTNAAFCQNQGDNPILNFAAPIPNDVSFSNPPTGIWMRLILGETDGIPAYTGNPCLNPFQYGDIKDIQIEPNGTSSGGYQDPHLRYPKKYGKGSIIDTPRFEHDHG